MINARITYAALFLLSLSLCASAAIDRNAALSEEAGSHNYYRDYEPATGRYIQSDPVGLRGGANTYSYVRGNPVIRIDPFGLVEWGGTVLSISGGAGPMGGGVDIYTLYSECVNGQRVVTRVRATYYTPLSAGWPAGFTGQGVSFSDSNTVPNSQVFSGQYAKVSAGVSVGIGYSYSIVTMGSASSQGGGFEAGFEAGVGWSPMGKTEVLWSKTEPCVCK